MPASGTAPPTRPITSEEPGKEFTCEATAKLSPSSKRSAAEGGRAVDPPARVAIVAAAVIENPWAGQGFVEDLTAGIDATASDLGALLAPRVLEALGAPAEAYGKAAIVGLDGEIEHGSALIHT